MKVVTLDFETFWSKTHSLSKMPPTVYVMHPETEIISCSIKVNAEPTAVYFGEDAIAAALAKIDWSDVLCIGHNMSGFDAMIVAWRFKIRPKMWGCTMAMARPIYAKTVGLGLAPQVEHHGLGEKNNAILLSTQGKHLVDFTKGEIADMAKYNRADTDQCYGLFKKLAPQTKPSEMMQIHMLIEKLVNPQFEIDFAMLEVTLEQVRAENRKQVLQLAEMLGLKAEALPVYRQKVQLLGNEVKGTKLDVQPVVELESMAQEDRIIEAVRKVLASAPQFAKLLGYLGADVPMKPSPKKPDTWIPALSKSDEGFQALLEHYNPLVVAAAECRLAVKSTLLETRIQAFMAAATACGGKLPVPVRYCGADTTGRDSGEQYNMLNLPRINPDDPKLSDALRMSLCAPKGYVVIVADLSGIELRVNHFLWKVPYSTKLYTERPDADLYRAAGAIFYGCTEDEITKMQRQMEKVKALGLGFGAGPPTFQKVAKLMSGGKVILSDQESIEAVYGWRDQHKEIVTGWRTCHERLNNILYGQEVGIDPCGLTHTSKEGIILPSSRIIRYPDLRKEVDERTGKTEWKYGRGRHTARIYAGKIDENIVQALARDVMAEADLQFYKDTGFISCLRVYDELVYIVPERDAVELLAHLQHLLRTPPKWWPELVTWSEGDIAPRYGEAK
jgi:DNA polymerase